MAEAKFDFIRYANCWEDPENLLRALDIKDRRGASVLSAGDNVFALLTADPAHITAFDVNPTQIHLFHLKKAGIKALSYEDLLRLLGVVKSRRAYALFLSLENIMDKAAFDYFLQHKEFFEKGIIHIGKFEHYFQIFRSRIIPLFSTKKRFARLASFRDVGEQAKYYTEVIDNRRMKAVCNAFFGFRAMGRLGRDKHFYDYVDDREDSGKNIKAIADYGLTHVPSYDNPFISYICLNSYPAHALPFYLRRENVELIKSRLDRIEVRHCDLLGLEGKFDFFNLSDIFEYMSGDAFLQNTAKLCELSNPGARALYYNMQNKRYFADSRLTLQKELSETLTNNNRAFFYRDCLVYVFGEQDEQSDP